MTFHAHKSVVGVLGARISSKSICSHIVEKMYTNLLQYFRSACEI